MLQQLEVENWRSHKHSTLAFNPGVNVLVGEMGSGKTSVLEALTYALYGTTPSLRSRTVTLDNVLRRHPEPVEKAEITLTFTANSETYTVNRVIKRGKGCTRSELRRGDELLEAPQTKRVTDRVEDILGIDYETFTGILYAEQNQVDYFLNLAPSERKDTIDELLRLDKFEDARSNTVTLRNRVKDRVTDLEDDLETLTSEDRENVDELEEALTDLKEKIRDRRDEKQDVEETLQTLEEELETLREKQEEAETLKEENVSLQSTIDDLETRIDNLEQDAANLSQDELEAAQQELEEEMDALKAEEEKYTALEKKKSRLTTQVEELEDDINTLTEHVETYETFPDVKETLQEKRETRDTVQDELAACTTNIETVQETLDTLSEADAECPVCKQELTEEHRDNLIAEKEDTLAELRQTRQELREKEEALQDDIDELQEEKDRLLQYQDAADTKQEKQELLEEKQGELQNVEDDLEEVNQDVLNEKREALENRRNTLETTAELHALQTKQEKKQEALNDIETKQEELDFDREALAELEETRHEKDKKHSLLQEKIEHLSELREEKKERLETVKEQEERIQELQGKIEHYTLAADFLARFTTALEHTQVDMRTYFVDAVNDTMQNIWNIIYPYDDYTTIRLNAEEDYLLELENGDTWVAADGETSGGERQSAALTLRIALASILAPDFKLLFLDEPTHNLDTDAIHDLADTIRTKLASLMDQVFLITHEEALDEAATGTMHHLNKKTTEHGLTEIEQLQ